jgi:hypothetical protein
MSECVPSKVAVSAKDLSAVGAFVWLEVGVGEEVGLQVGALVEGPRADGTLVRGLVHVQDLVHCQRPRLTKSLPTFRTFERLLLTVNVPEEENN